MEISWFFAFLGPFLIGLYFTFFGFWSIYHWTPLLQTLAERNLPHPYLLLPLGISWQILAGFMIMLSTYVKLAALLLIPYTILSVLIFNPFWQFKGNVRVLHLTVFVTHLTVTLGALILLILPIKSMSDLLT